MNNKKKMNEMIVFLIVFFVLGAISPFLAFLVILCFVIITRKKKDDNLSGKKDLQYVFEGETLEKPVKKQQGLDPSMKMHKDNTYDENKKSDYHGVSKENRDRSYTTRELYEDIANRKTDYRGVNKDLL